MKLRMDGAPKLDTSSERVFLRRVELMWNVWKRRPVWNAGVLEILD
jgi:hypothetical protein